MCKYEMDSTRTVGATERTQGAGRTDGQTELNQYTHHQLCCAGYNYDALNKHFFFISFNSMDKYSYKKKYIFSHWVPYLHCLFFKSPFFKPLHTIFPLMFTYMQYFNRIGRLHNCIMKRSFDWGVVKETIQRCLQIFGENLPRENIIQSHHNQGSFCACALLSKWETTLHCNVVSHWLGAYTKLSLHSRQYSTQLQFNLL